MSATQELIRAKLSELLQKFNLSNLDKYNENANACALIGTVPAIAYEHTRSLFVNSHRHLCQQSHLKMRKFLEQIFQDIPNADIHENAIFFMVKPVKKITNSGQIALESCSYEVEFPNIEDAETIELLKEKGYSTTILSIESIVEVEKTKSGSVVKKAFEKASLLFDDFTSLNAILDERANIFNYTLDKIGTKLLSKKLNFLSKETALASHLFYFALPIRLLYVHRSIIEQSLLENNEILFDALGFSDEEKEKSRAILKLFLPQQEEMLKKSQHTVLKEFGFSDREIENLNAID